MYRGIAGPLAFVALWAAGCGPSGSAVPTSATVHGRVVSGATLAPIPNVPIWIGSVHVSSDMNGEFVVADVEPSYDLVVSTPEGSHQLLWITKGLTRRDPVISLSQQEWPRQGTLHLTLSGPGDTGGTGDTAASWRGDARSRLLFSLNGPSFDASLIWSGAETTRGTVRILTYSTTNPSGLPTFYAGFGSLTTTVSSVTGAAPAAETVELAAVQSMPLTTTVAELPDGYVLDNHGLSVVFSDGSGFPLGGIEPLSGEATFTDLVPVLPDSSIQVWAGARQPGKGSLSVVTWSGPASASPVLRFAPAPTLLEPDDGAEGLPVDAKLSWAVSTPGPSRVDIFCQSESDPSATIDIRFVTAGTSVRLPDLADFGLSFPPGAPCSWWVYRDTQLLRDVDSSLDPPDTPAPSSIQTTEFSGGRSFFPP